MLNIEFRISLLSLSFQMPYTEWLDNRLRPTPLPKLSVISIDTPFGSLMLAKKGAQFLSWLFATVPPPPGVDSSICHT